MANRGLRGYSCNSTAPYSSDIRHARADPWEMAPSSYPASPLCLPRAGIIVADRSRVMHLHQTPQPLQQATQPMPRRHTAATQQPVCLGVGKLTVTIHKARDIQGDEMLGFGKADPYVLVKLGGRNMGQERRTSANLDAGSTPRWDVAFPFYIKTRNAEYNNLSMKLYDKNTLRPDKFLGHLTIANLGAFLWTSGNNVPANWYPIFLKNGTPKGEILLSFHLHPMEAEPLNSEVVLCEHSDCPPDFDPGRKYDLSMTAKYANVTLQGVGVLLTLATLL